MNKRSEKQQERSTKVRAVFKKINKIDKPLARLKEKKKRIQIIRNERGDIIVDTTEIKKKS